MHHFPRGVDLGAEARVRVYLLLPVILKNAVLGLGLGLGLARVRVSQG